MDKFLKYLQNKVADVTGNRFPVTSATNILSYTSTSVTELYYDDYLVKHA